MSITAEINELQSLNQEIQRQTTSLRNLRQRKKEVEKNISDFIDRQEKPGIKYKGNQFLPETKQKIDRTRKAKVKEQDARRCLENYGISETNSKIIVAEMLEAMRGPRQEVSSLKIKKLK